MQANRRSFLAGALAACGVVGKTAAAASGAATGTRRFDLVRGDTRIGRRGGKSAAIWPISICSTTDRANGLGSEFQARGETVRMVTLDVDASLSPLWIDAA